VTLCGPDDHEKVTVPAATVSGVGVKKLLLTVIVVRWPPVPPPGARAVRITACRQTGHTQNQGNVFQAHTCLAMTRGANRERGIYPLM